MGESIERMAQQADAFIVEELALLERMLAEPEGSQGRLEAGLGEVEAVREILAEVARKAPKV